MGSCLSANPSRSSRKALNTGHSDAEELRNDAGVHVEQRASDASSDESEEANLDINLRRFRYRELEEATSGFSQDRIIGEGGFGFVYKGLIDGQPIAIKKLEPDRSQGHSEWVTELKALGELRHQNLVELIGYCFQHNQRLLVFEYLPYSLDYLLSLEYHYELNWEMRMEIITGIAKGLAYLHSHQPPIIHRDVKPSNVLVDSNFNAKLCDFGMARQGPSKQDDESHVTTRVMGTTPYVDPEYYLTGKLRTRCDVYGFGVIILEMLTGRKALLLANDGRCVHITQWSKPWVKDMNKISEIMDPRLRVFPPRAAYILATLADWCTDYSQTKLRPEIEEVLEVLDLAARGRSVIPRPL